MIIVVFPLTSLLVFTRDSAVLRRFRVELNCTVVVRICHTLGREAQKTTERTQGRIVPLANSGALQQQNARCLHSLAFDQFTIA